MLKAEYIVYLHLLFYFTKSSILMFIKSCELISKQKYHQLNDKPVKEKDKR